MSAAHTPGPWVARFESTGDGIVLQQTSKRLICFIERFSGIGNRAHKRRTYTDLKLIAAAPDLLAALNAFLTHMGMDEDEHTAPTFKQARAAIAKATGATP